MEVCLGIKQVNGLGVSTMISDQLSDILTNLHLSTCK
jgi:hypothetical protein